MNNSLIPATLRLAVVIDSTQESVLLPESLAGLIRQTGRRVAGVVKSNGFSQCPHCKTEKAKFVALDPVVEGDRRHFCLSCGGEVSSQLR